MLAVPILALTRAETATRLGIAAAVALAVWLLLLGALAIATRARRPDAAPAALDLPGDEPPAVVTLLADGWRVGREAVPATLIDLAARKVLAIEPVGLDRFVVRLRLAATLPALNPYEDQVLRHVRSLASGDGAVPGEALTTGPEEASKSWWKRFEAAVVKDARQRGLSRGRWSKAMLTVLGVAAVVPSALVALAIIVVPPEERGSDDDNPVGAAIGLTAMGWMGLMALPRAMRAERDTPAGQEAASRWLGLREHLEGSGGFEDAPPAAVAIWDRYLSYGAALGVAPGAVRALPLGSESDKVAWTHFGGRWRVVEIDYPKRIPPGWGKHPALATAIAAACLLGGLFVARIFFPLMADAASELFNSTDGTGFDPVDLIGIGIIAVPTLLTALWLGRAALMLAAAGPDLFARKEVEGVVLRIRAHEKRHYLAVDDGSRDQIKAWLVEPTVLSGAGLYQGSAVSASISPRLGHVFRLGKPLVDDRPT